MARENYVGRAGQLAVMSKFLLRGYNVAIPEVDEGDDVLVIRGRADETWRVQVKTALAVSRNYGFSAQFQVPLPHLLALDLAPLFYVFALRRGSSWEFVPITQRQLRIEYEIQGVGSRAGENLILYLAFREMALTCSSRDWQQLRNNRTAWPLIRT